jgi:hypothetical protein
MEELEGLETVELTPFSHKDIDKISKHLIWDLLQMDDEKFDEVPKRIRNKVNILAGMFLNNDICQGTGKDYYDDYFTKDFNSNVEQLSFFDKKVLNQNDEIKHYDIEEWLNTSPRKTITDKLDF